MRAKPPLFRGKTSENWQKNARQPKLTGVLSDFQVRNGNFQPVDQLAFKFGYRTYSTNS